jgi:hypothetical protein
MVAKFCKHILVPTLMNLKSYKLKKYQQALEEVFIEIDNLLISKKGHEIFTQFELDEKNMNSKTMKISLNPVEDY